MPEERFAPDQKQVPDKKSKYLLLLALGLLLLSGGSAAGYFYLIRQAQPQPSKPATVSQPTLAPTPTPTIVKGVAEGKVFYPKDENIFSYDVETKQEEKWTSYPKNKDFSPAYDEDGNQIPNISIHDIKVIDGNTLGFGKCGVVTGDFGCGLYVLDLKTKEVTQRVELGGEYLLLRSGWFDEDRLAYLVSNDDKWQLYLADGSNTRLLVDLSMEAYGRGGFAEDSSKIEFSPDGTRLFHIATSSPRSPMDFTTHIYNTTTGAELAVIENSTQPDWLDNQRVIFRRYDADASSENGLYVYTIGSGAETKFAGTPTTAYRPELLPGTDQILYENNPEKQLWLYDLSSEENTLVVENALFGFWFSPTQIVYSNVTSCDDECGMIDYEVESIDIYDLSLSQKVGSVPNLKDTYGASSLYH